MAGGANITVNVICSPDFYTISGNYTGLNGNGLQIKLNNTGEALTYNNPPPAGPSGATSFSFTQAVANGTNMVVVVNQNPSGLNQTCGVTNGTQTVSGANISNVTITCTTNPYHVSGAVTGLLSGESFTLLMNGGSNDTITFADPNFDWTLNDGSTYAVTVSGGSVVPGIGKTCSVTNGSGTIAGANVTNVTVSCAFNTFTVGGTVTGLCSDQTIQVQNNAANTQTVSSSGSFNFTFPAQNDLSAYSVTVSSETYANLSCNVTNGSGNLANGNVTNVAIACTGCMSCAGATTITMSWTANRSYDVRNATGGGHRIYFDVSPGVTVSSPGVKDIPNTTSTTTGVISGRTAGCTYYAKVQPYSSIRPAGASGATLSSEFSVTP